jgi:hypothetical protein
MKIFDCEYARKTYHINHASNGRAGAGCNKRQRGLFLSPYDFGGLKGRAIFETDIQFPSLPSTTGRVGAVDPVRDDGEVGHAVRDVKLVSGPPEIQGRR